MSTILPYGFKASGYQTSTVTAKCLENYGATFPNPHIYFVAVVTRKR